MSQYEEINDSHPDNKKDESISEVFRENKASWWSPPLELKMEINLANPFADNPELLARLNPFADLANPFADNPELLKAVTDALDLNLKEAVKDMLSNRPKIFGAVEDSITSHMKNPSQIAEQASIDTANILNNIHDRDNRKTIITVINIKTKEKE